MVVIVHVKGAPEGDHDAVVLEMTMVNDNEGRIQQQGCSADKSCENY